MQKKQERHSDKATRKKENRQTVKPSRKNRLGIIDCGLSKGLW